MSAGRPGARAAAAHQQHAGAGGGSLSRESVWDYPRPPALLPVPQWLRVLLEGQVSGRWGTPALPMPATAERATTAGIGSKLHGPPNEPACCATTNPACSAVLVCNVRRWLQTQQLVCGCARQPRRPPTTFHMIRWTGRCCAAQQVRAAGPQLRAMPGLHTRVASYCWCELLWRSSQQRTAGCRRRRQQRHGPEAAPAVECLAAFPAAAAAAIFFRTPAQAARPHPKLTPPLLPCRRHNVLRVEGHCLLLGRPATGRAATRGAAACGLELRGADACLQRHCGLAGLLRPPTT